MSRLTIKESWERHKKSLKKYDATGFVFEFGAGKSLAQNLYISDVVNQQLVVDLNFMLEVELVEASRKLLANRVHLRSDTKIFSSSDLKKYGITYKAPCDASKTGLESESLDACISTNTLEHIPKESIVEILDELYRTLKRDGVVSAKIDYSDHYSHTDPSISRLNFLHFSEEKWEKFNHRHHFQNRMRHHDYAELFDHCGFRVMEEEVFYGEKEIPQALVQKYSGMPDTWAATSGYYLLKKK